ncbi:MAG: EAL domain-containing protein [Desulfobulbaceae bacterium]
MESVDRKQKKVLVIDDDASIREVITKFLRFIGYETLQAGSGESGLEQFEEHNPELVLLDLHMPGMDGFEVLQAITKRTRETPVIIISGVGTQKDTTRALRLGAWDYITKPFQELDILKHAVETALERAELQAANRVLKERMPERETNRLSEMESRTLELERAYNVLEREIQERKRAEKAIEKERAFMQNIIDGVRHPAMIVRPDRRVMMMNSALLALLPSRYVGSDNLLCHQAYRQVDTPCSGDDHRCVLDALREDGKAVVCRHRDVQGNGEEKVFELEASPMWNEDGSLHGFLEVIRNVTEDAALEEQLREHQERLYHLVHHDTLTSLPNRLLLQDRLQRMMVKAQRTGTNVGVLFLDLDRFKKVNETLGHEVGDKLLVNVAEILENCVRKSDTVARLSGDEFAVLLDDLKDVKFAAVVARKILQTLSRPIFVEEYELYATCSIGISVFPADSDDVEGLLRCADTALYRAKDAGRNNYQFYTRDMNTRAFEFLLMEAGLRKALDKDEFEVFYQPQMDLKDNRLVGMEALLRWNHPEKGMVAPGDFIPLAEETGLIESIGEWVLRAACRQNRRWQDQGYPPVCVSVNISARQFRRKDVVEMVGGILEETGLEPRYLELELTESIIMQDMEATIETFRNLKKMGVKLAIDDFGTGYSSLAYLKLFPIDHLKIDRSFVYNIANDPNDAAIAASVVVLAHSMNLKVVAEGVENAEQLAILREQGCDFVQGYFFSKPLSAREFVPFFEPVLRR